MWSRIYVDDPRSDDEKLQAWVGPSLKSMMQSMRVTGSYLEHPRLEMRLGALFLISEYWRRVDESFQPVMENIAIRDPEPQVRGAALFVLLRVHAQDKIQDPTMRKLMDALTGRVKPGFEQRLERVRQALGTSPAIQSVDDYMRRMWDQLAGPHVKMMLESRQAAEGFLASPDPNLRQAALSLTVSHWKPTADFAKHCERMAFEDSDPEVRAQALASLGTCYSETDDPRIGKLLAGVVRDNSMAANFRRIAFEGLYQVRGIHVLSWPSLAEGFRFPEDVDWPFVDSFMTT